MNNFLSNLNTSVKKIKPKNLITIFLIFFLCILAYGILIPWIGFYWDDWVFAWTVRFLGSAEFIPSFLPFRPFLGPIFAFTTSIFGTSPLAWQVFGLFVRFCTGLAAFWSLRKIWPNAKLQVTLVSLFFVVFPGYNQQWVALTHVNQEMISLLCYLLSLGFMVKAVRSHPTSLKYNLIALIFTFVGLYPTEYFFGLELLRPFILWFVLREKLSGQKIIISKTIRAWLPYLLLWISNAIFLYLYHNSPSYNSYGLNIVSFSNSNLITFFTKTVEDFIQTIVTTGYNAWANTITLLTKPLSQATTWITLGLIAISFAVTYLVVSKSNDDHTTLSSNSFAWQAIMLGIIGILVGRIPSWLAGLPMQLEFSWDRFMISMMLGGSLFIIGLVDFFVQQKNRKIFIACMLIAFAVGWQFMKANSFRREWENQRQLFWQLSWRIPGLKPGTLITTDELPLTYVTDQSLTAPLNWIYAPEVKPYTLPYMLAYTKARIGSELLPGLKSGVPISSKFRTMNYASNTNNIVVIYQEYPGCLRVMDPEYSNKDTLPGANYMILDAIPLSNLNQIITDAPQPLLPQSLFGKEPPHSWCYYFEKAELARQTGKWKEIASLGDEAYQNGFSASQPSENLVFIEAYARTARLDDANQLTQKIASQKPDLQPALCELWKRVQISLPGQLQIKEYLALLHCGGQ
jgi:hypothetical protein